MAFLTIVRKSPKKGCFLALKSQDDANRSIARVSNSNCSHQLSSNFLKVSEKSNGGIKSYEAKSFNFGHFGAFWGFFEPLGTQSEFFFQKSKNTIPLVK